MGKWTENLFMFMPKFCPQGAVGYIYVYHHNIQSSSLKPLVGPKVCINGQGHITIMAAMAINSKNLLKIFFSRTRRSMILKVGMKHQAMELYKV